LTYCAVGAFSFLECIPQANNQTCALSRPESAGFKDLVQWLVWRQTTELKEQAGEDVDGDGEDTALAQPTPTELATLGGGDRSSPDDKISELPHIQAASERPPEELAFAGFSGRLNKIADTCYCFWASGSLAVNICHYL
jgi:geranylgeranyl transferase type-1 subunit beta